MSEGKFDAAIIALNIALYKIDKESFLVRPETYEKERGQVVAAIALLSTLPDAPEGGKG